MEAGDKAGELKTFVRRERNVRTTKPSGGRTDLKVSGPSSLKLIQQFRKM